MMIPDAVKAVMNDQPYPLLFAAITGAHLYGFPSRDSDYDLRAVYVLPAEDALGLYSLRETVNSTQIIDGVEVDFVSHDVKMFMMLVIKKNGNVLEQLFSPLLMYAAPEYQVLQELVKGCITRHVSHHYLGFSGNKWKEFVNAPKAKNLLYVYRTLLTGLHMMETGEVQPNLVKLNEIYQLSYISELIDCKVNGTEWGAIPNLDMAFHEAEYQRLTAALEAAREKTHLPEHPMRKRELSDFLVQLRLKTLGGI